MIKRLLFQDSHGDYNVGPIMFFCLNYFVGFFSPNLFKSYVFSFLCFTPFNKLELSHHVCIYVGHTAELFYLQVK